MREQPNFKSDLVQRSSIATAVRRRTGQKVTNHDVQLIARHQGIDSIDKGDHEHYYTKLQAQSISIALLNKIAMDLRNQVPTIAAPSAPSSTELTAAEMVQRLRAMGYNVTCTREIKTIEEL